MKSYKQILKDFKLGLERGAFNVNEIREIYGLPPVDGGEVRGIMTPTGFVPLDRLNEYYGVEHDNSHAK